MTSFSGEPYAQSGQPADVVTLTTAKTHPEGSAVDVRRAWRGNKKAPADARAALNKMSLAKTATYINKFAHLLIENQA